MKFSLKKKGILSFKFVDTKIVLVLLSFLYVSWLLQLELHTTSLDRGES